MPGRHSKAPWRAHQKPVLCRSTGQNPPDAQTPFDYPEELRKAVEHVLIPEIAQLVSDFANYRFQLFRTKTVGVLEFGKNPNTVCYQGYGAMGYALALPLWENEEIHFTFSSSNKTKSIWFSSAGAILKQDTAVGGAEGIHFLWGRGIESRKTICSPSEGFSSLYVAVKRENNNIYTAICKLDGTVCFSKHTEEVRSQYFPTIAYEESGKPDGSAITVLNAYPVTGRSGPGYVTAF